MLRKKYLKKILLKLALEVRSGVPKREDVFLKEVSLRLQLIWKRVQTVQICTVMTLGMNIWNQRWMKVMKQTRELIA